MKFLGKFAAVVALAVCAAWGAVNINTATMEELQSIEGIGPKKAEAIIEYRTRAPFKSVEEIKNVAGINEKLFAKIKDEIAISGETKITPKPKKERKKASKDKKDAPKAKDKDAKNPAKQPAK